MKKAERVRHFLNRLALAEPCASHDEAYTLIEKTLNGVEDKYSGIPFNPATWKTDGRLYPPRADNSSRSEQHRDVIKYRSVGHWTFIAANGAFVIQEVASGKILIDRPGRDGLGLAAFASESKR